MDDAHLQRITRCQGRVRQACRRMEQMQEQMASSQELCRATMELLGKLDVQLRRHQADSVKPLTWHRS